MVELCLVRDYADEQIPKAIASTELTEHHAQQLIPTSEMLYISISCIMIYTTIKYPRGQMEADLRKYIFAIVHKFDFSRIYGSSRHRHFKSLNPCKSRFQRTF
jgi:hypothetical protein